MKSLKRKAPLPVILIIVAFLCPTEFSLYLAGLRIPPHRAALLLLLPWALTKLLMQRGLKLRLFDVAFLAFHFWTVGIFIYHQGYEGFVYGGSLALDGLGAYLVARVWVRDFDIFIASLRVMGWAIAVAALIALPETLLGKTFTHDFLRDLTGYVHPTAVETRLHLTRAYGSFDHPIHYGTFCAAMLSLFWFAARSVEQRFTRAALLFGATLLGLSSAPILCFFLQVGMLVWERATRGVASRTAITLAVLTGFYIGASVVMSRSPINFIATGMTLDSWTGYYRLQIWENGLLNVYANPWTGIGLGEWQRPWWMVSSTVDAFWLVILMREGIPGLGSLVLGLILLGRATYKRGLHHPDLRVRRLARGWFMSLIALSLVGCTVHYWNVLYAFFFFFTGTAGWMADPVRAAAKAKVTNRAASDRARAQRYSMGPKPAHVPGHVPAPAPIYGGLPGQAPLPQPL